MTEDIKETNVMSEENEMGEVETVSVKYESSTTANGTGIWDEFDRKSACDVAIDPELLKDEDLTGLVNMALYRPGKEEVAKLVAYLNKDFVYCNGMFYYCDATSRKWIKDKKGLKLREQGFPKVAALLGGIQVELKKGKHTEREMKALKKLGDMVSNDKVLILTECEVWMNSPDFAEKLDNVKGLIAFENGVNSLAFLPSSRDAINQGILILKPSDTDILVRYLNIYPAWVQLNSLQFLVMRGTPSTPWYIRSEETIQWC